MKLKLFIILLVSAFSFSAFAEKKIRKPQYDCRLNKSVVLKVLFEYDNEEDTTPVLVLQTKTQSWNNKFKVKKIAVFSDPTVVQDDNLLVVLAQGQEEETSKYVYIRIEKATITDDEGEPSGTYLRGLIDFSLDGVKAGILQDTSCSFTGK